MDSIKRIDNLLEMLIKEPNDVFLNYALGLEYIKSSDTNKAELQFKKVLQFDVNYIAAYYQLGKLYESLQQNNMAIDYYNFGLEKAKTIKNNKAINEFGEAIFMLTD